MSIKRMLTTLSFAALVAAGMTGARSARAEIIELVNGGILQGQVDSGKTTDEGLAVHLFETDGIAIVKWDHIEGSRRRALRLEHGIDLPEETVEMVDGHRVRLVDGAEVVGVAENPRAVNEPLRMKTRTGVKTYERSVLAGPVQDVKIDGLLVYTVEELYQQMRDANPPETAAAHKALALRCMNIGAYEHAKQHLLAAREDPDFMKTAEGKAVEAGLRNVENMILAKGAADLKAQINQARSQNRWNEAKKLLEQLAKEYKDPNIRNTISFDLLEARTLKQRDVYFQKEVALAVYRTMEQMIEAKAREQKPAKVAEDFKGAVPGTLAAARQWENKDLYKLIWDKVAKDLDLKIEELESYWKDRSVKQIRRANYGTGSFIVVKKVSTTKPGAPPPPPPRRPPGSDPRGGAKTVPAKPTKSDKPATEEEWWGEKVGPSDRTRWLIANFVETSGMFDIIKTEQLNCKECEGRGFNTSSGADGTESQHFCVQCNGAGVTRTVSYR